jgi:ribonucleoside-diphosphate reductase alpha chain
MSVAMQGSAEPGTLFLERANKFSNTWYFNPLICTNPCGEQFLSAWSVCNLGHVNLSKMVEWDEQLGRYVVNWEKLMKTTRALTRALDNVIDATPYYFDVNKKQQESERRLGLGTMGVDELLKLTGFDYGSDTGRALADEVFRIITLTAYDESVNIAKEKGSFPEFEENLFMMSGFMEFLGEEAPWLVEKIREHGIRNATIITQAPTGTTGTMAQTSTGIEPFYAGTFFRSSRIGFTTQTAPVIKRMEAVGMDTAGLKYAGDYNTKQHLDFQAVAQKWCDSSISKTINAPAGTSVEDVEKLLEYAYDSGLKGFTVYVDGSREGQVLSTEETPSGDSSELPMDRYDVKSVFLKGSVSLGHEEGKLKKLVIDIDSLKEGDLEAILKHAVAVGLQAHESTDCNSCGAPLRFEEGCFKCEACGFSKCG